MRSPSDPLADRQPITYTVAVDTVGRSLRFSVSASWPFRDAGRNSAEGVLTSIEIAPGSAVEPGDILYTVNLRPVVVAEGVIPAFRDLALRAEGGDVAQLQALLRVEGLYQGEVDGVFDSEVRAAVRQWQSDLGVAADGVVRSGDVVYVEHLPARVMLDPDLVVGSRLSGGEVLVREVLEEPEFTIVLASGQGVLVPLRARVDLEYEGRVWSAYVASIEERPMSGEIVLRLAGESGSVCGADCVEAVPLVGSALFPAQIVVVPEVTGPAIPVAALMTRPDGSVMVQLMGGSEVDVTVLASAGGLAVVNGLDPGNVVLLPSETPP